MLHAARYGSARPSPVIARTLAASSQAAAPEPRRLTAQSGGFARAFVLATLPLAATCALELHLFRALGELDRGLLIAGGAGLVALLVFTYQRSLDALRRAGRLLQRLAVTVLLCLLAGGTLGALIWLALNLLVASKPTGR